MPYNRVVSAVSGCVLLNVALTLGAPSCVPNARLESLAGASSGGASAGSNGGDGSASHAGTAQTGAGAGGQAASGAAGIAEEAGAAGQAGTAGENTASSAGEGSDSAGASSSAGGSSGAASVGGAANVGGAASVGGAGAGGGNAGAGGTGGSWNELSLSGGPSGAVLSTGPLVNYDPVTGRLIVFYPLNPTISYANGQTSQVWLLDHANGLGGSPTWTRLAALGDLPNNINGSTTAVYTPANQLLVYGGCGATCSPAQSDVYQLSNANGVGGAAVWSRATIAAPRARSGHQSAFDPSTGKMISFGGNLAFYGTDQNDAAIFDTSASAWSTLSITGTLPGARAEAFSSAYDAATARFMIFGGDHLISSCCPSNESQYNDLWVLANANGVGTPAWQQLSPAGTPPSPRGGNSAVFDPVHNRLLVYGGSTWSNATQLSTPLGELWQVTYANGLGGSPEWSQLFPKGVAPGPLSNPGAAFDSQAQRMILVGMGDIPTSTPPRVWVLVL